MSDETQPRLHVPTSVEKYNSMGNNAKQFKVYAKHFIIIVVSTTLELIKDVC